jgi:hypothetical protein
VYAGTATNGEGATTTSNDYGVHGTTVRTSNERVKTKTFRHEMALKHFMLQCFWS